MSPRQRLDRANTITTAAELAQFLSRSTPKFRNTRFVDADGVAWDSKLEAKHWALLKLQERAGEIFDLKRQVTCDLTVNGHLVARIRLDYRWLTTDGTPVYADAKGVATRDWLLRAKLFRAIYGTEIRILK